MTEALLSVRDLSCEFRRGRQRVLAVDGVSFDIAPGEVLGLIGESGSGKSTVARMICGLTPRSGGDIRYCGQSLPAQYSRIDFQRHATAIQMVFQDCYSTMNPRLTVLDTLVEPLRLQGVDPATARTEARHWLDRVGLSSRFMARYPHQLSGGQRQRVGIARALVNRPRLLICDEPVSALDVSVQAQIVNLLRELQREEQLGMLFIAHDLAVVNYIADRSLVMYRGRILEQGGRELYASPAHPYTNRLLDANPVADPRRERENHAAWKEQQQLASNDSNDSVGCSYAPRCPRARERCREQLPVMEPVDSGGQVACFNPISRG